DCHRLHRYRLCSHWSPRYPRRQVPRRKVHGCWCQGPHHRPCRIERAVACWSLRLVPRRSQDGRPQDVASQVCRIRRNCARHP
ncbi:hypothetical protein AeRB84_008858, partial [Aphanomyces euteiches]